MQVRCNQVGQIPQISTNIETVEPFEVPVGLMRSFSAPVEARG